MTAQYSVTAWTMVERLLNFTKSRTIYLFGPPGVGKTYAAYHFGRIERGVYAVTLTDETSSMELRGHYLFKGGDAIWHDGPFLRAMRDGARLVINEISNGNADVVAMLIPLLESVETCRLTIPEGETVTPAKGFHIVCTDNRSLNQMPEHFQDRFQTEIELPEMHPDALNSLSEIMRTVAKQTIGDADRHISVRGWKTLAEFTPEFGLEDACKLVFGPDRGQQVSDAIKIATCEEKGIELGESYSDTCSCEDCEMARTEMADKGVNFNASE
jgi:hypothetical protein